MTHVTLQSLTDALREAGLLAAVRGTPPVQIDALTDDSRAVTPGALFVAVRGADRDGHDYLEGAASAGAAVAIVDDPSRTALPAIVVTDTRRAASVAAAAFHGFPARELRLVGVTGTNGKTTTVGMLRHLLDAPGARAASIGTLGVLVGSEGAAMPGGSGLTTPGPVELQRVLRELVTAGVRTVAMETSSHALHQHRVDTLRFAAAVFTNLTRDHLDYHGTMDAYFAAKAMLVGLLTEDGVAVTNADDPAWDALPPSPRRVRFGFDASADVRAADVRFLPRGSEWTLVAGGDRQQIALPLIGDFNVANALAAAATAWSLGVPARHIAGRLRSMPQVPGRLEIISEEPVVLRDYAHTPDALERALQAVRPFATNRLLVVFGCGGDRDRGKRPEMGRIAQRDADLAIVTSDNPRTEDPGRILDDIEAGMTAGAHERVEDRRTAIARAITIAGDGDVVLLAGKGHETYQVRGTVKYPFDEREIVGEILRESVAARTH
ncbi:MAG TPA: UDP-N-acetylmuramoyl-L-alanyl-D-glutamate--2,6-diaminopimelate ligase [Gemmatimonadaceae bacterium]|nr:UDP-N-acetylmuramoyl-L-alanyl-D-glutamate--2,6-diaminopimelate ligase [Gemmatimonadaceae bacterium]